MCIFIELFMFKYDRINLDNCNNWKNMVEGEEEKEIYKWLATC